MNTFLKFHPFLFSNLGPFNSNLPTCLASTKIIYLSNKNHHFLYLCPFLPSRILYTSLSIEVPASFNICLKTHLCRKSSHSNPSASPYLLFVPLNKALYLYFYTYSHHRIVFIFCPYNLPLQLNHKLLRPPTTISHVSLLNRGP